MSVRTNARAPRARLIRDGRIICVSVTLLFLVTAFARIPRDTPQVSFNGYSAMGRMAQCPSLVVELVAVIPAAPTRPEHTADARTIVSIDRRPAPRDVPPIRRLPADPLPPSSDRRDSLPAVAAAVRSCGDALARPYRDGVRGARRTGRPRSAVYWCRTDRPAHSTTGIKRAATRRRLTRCWVRLTGALEVLPPAR